jgi:hypothetical protein
MRQLLICFIPLLLLAACDNPPATLIPTRELSGPTLAPTEVILPVAPQGEPTQLLNAGQNDPTAAALPSGAELPPLEVGTSELGASHQAVQITVADGVLDGDLYPNPQGGRVPGILLLAPDRTAWLDLPLRMQAAGFTVLSVNIPTNDTPVVPALLEALIQISAVDPGRVALVGAESGADAALAGCAADTLCDALALFTPLDRTRNLDAMLRYNPRPIFIAAGTGSAEYAVAESVGESATGGLEFRTAPGDGRGAALLLAQPSLSDNLIAWLDAQLGAGIIAAE